MNLNMSKRIVIAVFILFSINSFSQHTEMLNVEFGSFGKKDDAVGISRSSININFPTQFYKGVLINGLSYSQYDLDYDSNNLMNSSSIETFKTINYSLSYMQKLNSNWAYVIVASPIISSNFESSLTMDDVAFNGGLIFTKFNRESKLKFGLIYNTVMGFDGPIPFLNYSREINDRFSYDLGFPITKVNFKINDRNKLNLHVKPKGFYSNISKNLLLDNSKIAEKAKYQSFVTGINYLHTIDNYWKVAFDVGYQLSSDYNLLDENKNSVHNIETKNSVYVGVNLKFDLLKKGNKNEKL